MPGRDFTSALARILTDRPVREAFRRDPLGAARRLSVRGADLEAFLSLDVDCLAAQAETLVGKRFYEVAGLIPRTIASLGGRDEARRAFDEYAATRWPEGHRRHLDDAVTFCDHLLQQGRKTVCRAEYHRLRFALRRRRFSVHLVRDLIVEGRLRSAIQILYRTRGDFPRQLALFVEFPFRSGRRSSRPLSSRAGPARGGVARGN